MSATRDKSQKTTFVYSNLYQLYRKGKEAAKAADLPVGLSVDASMTANDQKSYFALPSTVLKAGDANVATAASVAKAPSPRVEPYNPPELLGKRIVQRSETALVEVEKSTALPASDAAIQSLRQNLKTLNDLHARLRFMLQELEELVKG